MMLSGKSTIKHANQQVKCLSITWTYNDSSFVMIIVKYGFYGLVVLVIQFGQVIPNLKALGLPILIISFDDLRYECHDGCTGHC